MENNSLLTDRSIDILCSLRVGPPDDYAQQDRENIERALVALIGGEVKVEVTYKEHAE